ncbi:MAG: response regulator, partial [Anaerolineae bacterium]|nr:response regulator [Anaerolineae bacterium]
LLGYSVEETRDLDIPSIAVIAPEDEDEARRNLEQVVSGQQLPIYERTVVSKSGQHTPVEVNMVTVRAEDGRPQYGIAIARDISERKRHEQALEQSERFARSTVDALSAHIAILDENGTIVAVNRAWREFAEKNGAKSNVCEGANYLAVCDSAARIGSSEARDFAAGIRAVIQGESTVFAMEYACHAPRERRWFVGRVTRFPGGSPTRVVVAHENITQGKQQEEALAKAIEQAQVANEAKSIFLAHMSHELRTPLNAILGHAQLLAMEDNLMAQTHQRINVIENSGQHLLQIINDVLDMARIEAGRITINTVAVDLYGLLDSIRQVFAPKASEKQLQLVLDIAPTVPSHILADEGKLRQILTNLIGNAIKFTEAGVINLRCAFTPGEQQTGRLFLEVEDSGKGIEPDQIERLFRPFEQLEPVAVGSGLGLAISRNFARLMDGDIHVRSARGSGSVFVLELPVTLAADQRAAYDPLEVIGVAPAQTEYRLLIVEDDAESRTVLREFLQLVGLKPELAADGEAALDVYRHWRPHVLLLDMQLPKLDGYEVTRRIRQEYADDQTLIIAITASAFVQQRAAILASGCNDLLTKPYTHSQLFALLAKHTNIQFLYRERAPARTKDHQPPVIARELLMQLSQAQLRALYQAALTGYNPAARKLVQEIETEHPALAARLNDMVDSFWITAIADQIAPLLD